jgi:hypothetical protein
MAIDITINSITSGQSPYNLYVCDMCSGGTCQLIGTITTAPYTFTLPSVYETYSSYAVKLIDNNGCSYCEEFSISGKQFQDGDYFEFMDGVEFDFQ